ncbi:MAG TPA: lipocalin family protein [Puia sp.]|nr:lipocalin family protein [Puia sp.]
MPVEVVRNFAIHKYLGKWYEIARLDVSFERDLSNVTATYSLNPNGSIRVDNQGYAFKKNKWKGSIGKAKFVSSTDEGRLKVSFFGPFYAAYNIARLDKEYRYALVVGSSSKYMWILAREKTIPDNIKTDYLNTARQLGYDTAALIWTIHDQHS